MCILGWGSTWTFTDIAARHTSGLMLAGLRLPPAALVLLPAYVVLRRRLPGRAEWRLASWTALLMVVGWVVCISEGTARAGAGNAGVLTNTSSFFVLGLSVVLLRYRPTPLAVIGMAIGFGGVVLMVWPQLLHPGDVPDLAGGLAFDLAASASWAVGTVLVKRVADRRAEVDFLGLTTAQYVISSFVVTPIAFAVEGTGGTDWGSGELWGAVAALLVLGSLVGMLAFFGALRRLPAATVSATLFLLPVVAVLIEIGRGNVPEGIVLGGMALAVAGVAAVNVSPAPSARSGAPAT